MLYYGLSTPEAVRKYTGKVSLSFTIEYGTEYRIKIKLDQYYNM